MKPPPARQPRSELLPPEAERLLLLGCTELALHRRWKSFRREKKKKIIMEKLFFGVRFCECVRGGSGESNCVRRLRNVEKEREVFIRSGYTGGAHDLPRIHVFCSSVLDYLCNIQSYFFVNLFLHFLFRFI